MSKHNIIIIAKCNVDKDMELYQLLYSKGYEIHKKANIYIMPDVEPFNNLLINCKDDFQFSLLVHVGATGETTKYDGQLIIEQLKQLPYYEKMNYDLTSRKGKYVEGFGDVVYTLDLLHPTFDPSVLKSNILSNVMSEAVDMLRKSDDSAIKTEAPSSTAGLDFVIQTALFEHEFAVYKSKCKLDSAHGVYNSYNALFKEKIQLAHGVDYESNFLVVHQEQMGLVDAAIHSTQVISLHDPTFVIMSGVCGGRKGQVNQYDVIIPTTVYDYATGKFKEGKLESLEYEASLKKELTKFLNANNDKIVHNMRSLIDEDRKDLLSKDFKIVIDEFACGPWVVKTEGFLNKMAGEELTKYSTEEENKMFLESIPVNKINEKIKGLEMESYSILRAGEVIQRPNHYSLVVKSVMDFTNEYKNDGQFKEIKSSASYISFLCVRAMMPLLLDFKNNIEKWKK